jgi:hypothetical protein
MIQYPNLIPECNVDTVFVETMGYPNPNHAPSISAVCAILEKKPVTVKAIGFIDNDKRKPAYLKHFSLSESQGNIQLLKHKSKDQWLIVVSPAMDRFIFDLCGELGIDLSKYGLPTRFSEFLSRTKREAIRSDPRFKNLVNTLRQKNPPQIAKIKAWITKHHG